MLRRHERSWKYCLLQEMRFQLIQLNCNATQLNYYLPNFTMKGHVTVPDGAQYRVCQLFSTYLGIDTSHEI